MRIIYIACIAATLAACGPQPAPVTPAPMLVGDSGIGAGDEFDQACARLRALRCDEGFDKLGEDSCDRMMRRAQKARIAEMNPTCVRAADTVAAVKRCGPYCKKVVGYAAE
jgi:hypothetical protein